MQKVRIRMQIVIDIPDEDYKRIKDMPDAFNSLTSRAYKSIKNGTPLDKISAEIEQAADKQFQIAMGVSDLNERYAHIQMENSYRHSLNIIDKYKAEGSKE